MKYIIELEDAPIRMKSSHTGEAYNVYKAKEFRSLVFDVSGLRKLERYDTKTIVHEAYRRGYEAGLTEGRKQAEDSCEGCANAEKPISAHLCMTCRRRYPDKYQQAVEPDDEIRVGDEVIVNGLTGVVMRLDEKGNVDRYFTSDGKTFGNISGFQNNEVIKTGRHFDEVEKLLEAMKK